MIKDVNYGEEQTIELLTSIQLINLDRTRRMIAEVFYLKWRA